MSAYFLCPSCSSHVKAADTVCPLCGASAPSRRDASTRSARERWLACGGSALALIACDGNVQAPASGLTASEGSVANSSLVANAASSGAGTGASSVVSDAAMGQTAPDTDAGSVDGGLVDLAAWLTSGRGDFPCNAAELGVEGGTCDRGTQWCYTANGFDPTGCVSLGATCVNIDYTNAGDVVVGPGVSDACISALEWDPSLCDGGIRRCACLTTIGNCRCTDDSMGGITVSCGSCYGAPPARHVRNRRQSPRFREAFRV